MGAVAQDRQARFLERVDPACAAATLEEICQRVSDDETLAEVCKAWDLPFGRVRAWIAAEPEREAAYHAALRLRADQLAGETIAIADDVTAFPQQKRVRIDTRFKLASYYDKQRFGDAPTVAVSNSVVLKLSPEDERVI
jgi:hypothetical protein